MAYFDWNATTPLHPAAQAAWIEASDACWANPSTAYRLGARARLKLDEARSTAAQLLQVHPEQVVFTSGATESINGFIREAAIRAGQRGRIWISAVEHPAVRKAAVAYWGAEQVTTIPVEKSGTVDMDWFHERFAKTPPDLVAVMAINNETGVIQPWQDILLACESAGVPFFCDAVQWMGKYHGTNAPWNRCAGVCASAHKFGGPKGTGLLILGDEWRGLKLQHGGSQENDSRAGTEDLPGVVSMMAALEARLGNDISGEYKGAREVFEHELEALWPDDVIIHGKTAPRGWNTTSVSLPGHKAPRWVARLDKRGFQISSGSACSTGKPGPSATLQAMGLDEELASRSVRISSGWETRPGDWMALLEAIKEVRLELDEPDAPTGPGKVIEL